MFKKLSILLLLCLLAGCQKGADGMLANGQPFKLSDYLGKWVVVNYWANWCTPCLEEMPQLNQFYQAHKAEDAVVVAVSYDPISADQIQDFAKIYHVEFPMLQQFKAAKFGVKEVNVVPTSLLFGPKGKLRRTLLGPQTKATIEAAIEKERAKEG